MSNKTKRKMPKRLPITVLHSGSVILAVHKDDVYRIVRGEQGDCDECPFKKLCDSEENDIDSFLTPCSSFGEDVCRFVRLVDESKKKNKKG